MAKTNNPIDFAATTFTQFAINTTTTNTAGPNNLDVNGAVAVGTFAGVATAPTNSLVVSGNVGIGTSATSAFGYLTLLANPSPNQQLFYKAGTSNFTTTTTAGATRAFVGVAATSGNTITNGCGFDIGPNFSSNAGIITNASGVQINAGAAGAGTITNAYSFFATTPTYVGAATNVYTAYFQGKTGFNATNPINLVDISGSAAVGAYAGVATAPANGLIVSGQASFSTSAPFANIFVTVNGNYTDTTVTNSGLLVNPTLSYSTTAPLNNSVQAVSLTNSSTSAGSVGTIGSVFNYFCFPVNIISNAGSVTNAYGTYIAPTFTASGTGTATSNLYGAYVQPAIITGTPAPTFSYGLYSALPTSAQNNYSGYFAISGTGGVGIGATPINALDVNGGATIGAFGGVFTAPTNGLFVSGNVGVGTSTASSSSALLIGASATTTTIGLLLAGTASNTTNIPLYSLSNLSAFSLNGTVSNVYGSYSKHLITVAASAVVQNSYGHYFDANSVTLGASATVVNAYSLYNLTPTVGRNNYCAYFQGTIYIPNGWTIGQPGGTADICAAYVENGSYTPVLSSSAGTGTITYTTQAGYFTRIGKRLFLDVQVAYSNIAGTTAGNMQVSLPLAARNVTGLEFSGTCDFINVTLPVSGPHTNPPAVVIQTGASVCNFYSSQTQTVGTGGYVQIANTGTAGTVLFSTNYLVT